MSLKYNYRRGCKVALISRLCMISCVDRFGFGNTNIFSLPGHFNWHWQRNHSNISEF